MMTRFLVALTLIFLFFLARHPVAWASEPAAKALQGVWLGQSVEVDGKAMPDDSAKRMRFKFEGGKLFMTSNLKNDRETECTFRLDPKKSPKHFDFTPPEEQKTKTILGIYEVK